MNTTTSTLATLLAPLEQRAKTQELISYKLLASDDGEDILKELSNVGYIGEPRRTIRGDILTIQLTVPNWDRRGCPIFSSWSALFEKVSNANSIPEFIVAEAGHPTNNSENTNRKKLQLFCDCRELLSKLADHCEPKIGATAAGRDRLLFLIESEKLSDKYDFSPRVTWEELSTIENVDELLTATSSLIGAISVNDSQDTERRSVMRSAFAELMSLSKEGKESFLYILSNMHTLLAKYTEHHELFINRFSVNKVLQEISQQNLQYTSKINEIISGAQTKALTIPGAFIAISAAMKIDHLYDAIGVSTGLAITTLFIHMGTNVHLNTYSHIRKQIENEFERYDCLAEKAEVRQQAKTAQEELIDQVDKANSNLKKIRTGIWATLAVAVIYICASFSSLPNDNNSGDIKTTTNNSAAYVNLEQPEKNIQKAQITVRNDQTNEPSLEKESSTPKSLPKLDEEQSKTESDTKKPNQE